MPVSIREALKKEDGEPIIGLVGKVTEVYDPRFSEKDDKPWSVVNFMLEADGDKARCTWWNFGEIVPKSMKEKTVTISATKGKNGWFGAKVEHSEYKGKPQIGITINGDHLTLGDATRPEQASTSARQASTSTGNLTDRDLLDACDRWAERFRSILWPAPTPTPEAVAAAVGPLVSTFIIAATNGKLTIQPVGVAQREPGDDDPLGDWPE